MNEQQNRMANSEVLIPLELQKADSFQMFDRIYKRYDLLNHLLSLGQDMVWRHKTARKIAVTANQELLDLATGTGDVAFAILSRRQEIRHAYGCDMAVKMLEMARKKALQKKMAHRVTFIQGDAGAIPFESERFHTVTMAFGIRNVVDPVVVLKEIHRVLKPGGQTLILEFSMPTHPFIRCLHLFYLRNIIPLIGAILSKDKRAYRYLNETIETFPYGLSFCDLMKQAGFGNVTFAPLTFGVATLYQGEKKI